MSKAVALVTGSNRGIGASCIEEFARKGVNVIINYCHHEKEAKDLERHIRENYNVDVLTIKCDISKEEEVEKMINTITDHFGGIDILVNNASVSRDSLLLDKNIKEFKRVLDVNLIGTYLCSKYAGKVMLNQKRGKIINISSTNAIDTYYPESCDYDASKAGIAMLTQEMALELSDKGITVNGISYGACDTPMNSNWINDNELVNKTLNKIPLKWIAKPEEIARFTKIVLQEFSDYATGSIFNIDGGRNLTN